MVTELQTQATAMVGQQWARRILEDATNNQTLARNIVQVPQAISPAIGFSMYNLRPFYPYVATPAVSIGLIYLIIISFFSFSFYLPIHFKVRRAQLRLCNVASLMPHIVPQARRPSSTQVPPAYRLATVRNTAGLRVPLPVLLPHFTGIPGQLLRRGSQQ